MSEQGNRVSIPDIKTVLATGLQFGHDTSKWNPAMSKYIYTSRKGIHIIDVVQSLAALEKSVDFLQQAASRGHVVFVGTKRQSSEIVKAASLGCGAFFVVNRWPGGLLTNFAVVKRSLDKLLELEKQFEQGVEGRTKYEVSRMKSEWERLDRLYGGIKTMTEKPTAVVVVDPNYEKVAVREGRKIGVPVVALADTNCNPSLLDYVIPGNDDAMRSIELVVNVLAAAVKEGNGGKGIQHNLRDYSDVEVKLLRPKEIVEETQDAAISSKTEQPVERIKQPVARVSGSKQKSKGILERAKEGVGNEVASKRKPAAKADDESRNSTTKKQK